MGCADDAGWQLNGESVISGYGHEDDALLVLQLSSAGFRKMESNGVYGQLSFEFELQCQSPSCQVICFVALIKRPPGKYVLDNLNPNYQF